MGAKKTYKRRQRRRAVAKLTRGASSVAAHRSKTGRTGHVHAKRTRSRADGLGEIRREVLHAFNAAWAKVTKLLGGTKGGTRG